MAYVGFVGAGRTCYHIAQDIICPVCIPELSHGSLIFQYGHWLHALPVKQSPFGEAFPLFHESLLAWVITFP